MLVWNDKENQTILQLHQFILTRDSYFDVTAENAIEAILTDSRKSMESREEDAEFVRRLRRNDYVAFGGRDFVQKKRFERSDAREEAKIKREEKELKRKQVQLQDLFKTSLGMMRVGASQ